MSKKDRLKAQKEKQDIANRELEENERLEKEEAKEKQSKAAKKMLRRAKFFRPNNEHVSFLLVKILMLVPFCYSGFFWGGVTVVAIQGGQYLDYPPPKWVGYVMLISMIVMLVGIIFAFYRKYIVSFVLCIAGSAAFYKAGHWFVNYASKKLAEKNSTGSYIDDSVKNLDKVYAWRYYPILALAGISLILLAMAMAVRIHNKRIARMQRDSAPVKSIISD